MCDSNSILTLVFSFQPSDTTDQPTGPTSDAAAAAPALVIWGTDVVVSETKDKFRKFITEFVDEDLDPEEMGEGFDPLLPVYMQRLDEVNIQYVKLPEETHAGNTSWSSNAV